MLNLLLHEAEWKIVGRIDLELLLLFFFFFLSAQKPHLSSRAFLIKQVYVRLAWILLSFLSFFALE